MAPQSRAMKRDYPDRPIIGVLAVVRRDAEVLIVRRARAPSAGRWGFPGGLQELGETVFAAATRELAEETGIAAHAIASMPILDVIRPDRDGRIQSHWTLVPVVCDWRSGDGALSDEVAAWRWIAPQAIAASQLDVLPNLERIALLAMNWSAP